MSGFFAYLLRRIAQAILVVIGVLLIMFLLAHLIPGGAARAALGPRATPLQINNFNRLNGYDLPLYRQFWRYIYELLPPRFNLGYSYHYNEGVSTVIGQYLPKTILLVGISIVLALVIAVPLGILQVVRRNKPIDYALTGLSFVLYGSPPFLLGTLLILWFAVNLHIFPTEAPQASTVGGILADPRALVLPELTLAGITIASFSRYTRGSMMEQLTEDYVRTARAKGVSSRRILFLHALRNALIPLITLLGYNFPLIFSGALLTETVFNYPGMGLLTYRAVTNTDVPLLLGCAIVATLATVAGSFLADVLYAAVDPRIRYGRA
jgi:peptide/nickel transport system permease protein